MGYYIIQTNSQVISRDIIKNLLPKEHNTLTSWLDEAAELDEPAEIDIISPAERISDNVFSYGFVDEINAKFYIGLPESLSEIGNYGFYREENITQPILIKIPENIVSLGKYCFAYKPDSIDYSDIVQILFPRKCPYLTVLDQDMFSDNLGLTKLSIPEGVVELDDNALKNTVNLKTISLPTTLKRIPAESFKSSGFILDWEENKNDNLILGEKSNILIKIKPPLNEDENILDLESLDNITVIAGGATISSQDESLDPNGYIKEIKLPTNIISIGDYAFSELERLDTINIPRTIEYIGYYVFNDNFYNNNKLIKKLENLIYIPDDKNENYYLSLIDEDEIKKQIINEEIIKISNKTRVISAYLFSTLGTEEVFENREYIRYYNDEFSISVDIEDNNKRDLFINSYSFYLSAVKNISSLFSNFIVKEIGYCAFMDCPKLILNNIEFPEGLIIMPNAFSLSDIESINENKIIINSKLSAGSFSTGCFHGRYFHTVTLGPESETKPGCLSGVTGVNLNINSRKVEYGYLGNGAFSYCNFENILIGTDSEESTVEKINEYSFYNNSSISNVIIKNTLIKDIERGTFYNNTGLKSVIFYGNNKNLSTIGKEAFYNCGELTEVMYIPDTISSIKESAFSGCKKLKSVVFSGNDNELSIIEKKTFYNCNSLTHIIFSGDNNNIAINDDKKEVYIPEGVTTIGDQAFSNCTSIEVIYLPSTIRKIGNEAFYNCTNLKKVYIPKDITWYNIDFGDEYSNPLSNGGELYINNIKQEEIEIGSEIIKRIKKYCFSGYKHIKKISINDNIELIDDKVFINCSNLESVTINSTKISFFSRSLFENCSNLTEITFNNTIKQVRSRAFYNCSKLKLTNSFKTLFETVKSIETEAFKNCSSFGGEVDLTFGTNLINLSANSFYNTGVKKIVFNSNNITSIEGGVFSNCENLSSVKLPPNLRIIRSEAFYNCKNLSNLGDIPNSLEEIGDSSFEDCSALSEINFKSKILLRKKCFKNCKNLSISDVSKIQDIEFEALLGTKWYNNQNDGPIIINNGIYDYKGTTTNTELDLSGDNYNNIIHIYEGAFKFKISKYGTLSSITEIKLPINLRYIRNSAFEGCDKLIYINKTYEDSHTFSKIDTINVIGIKAFYNCTGLEKTLFSSAFLLNPDNAETNDPNLKWEVKSGIEFIGNSAFENCTNLKGLCYYEVKNYIDSYYGKTNRSGYHSGFIIWNNLMEISSRTFYNCTLLRLDDVYSIEADKKTAGILGNQKIRKIGEYAFSRIEISAVAGIDLETMFPNLKDIGSSAFEESTIVGGGGKKEIFFPPTITHIRNRAFYNLTVEAGEGEGITFNFLNYNLPFIIEENCFDIDDTVTMEIKVQDRAYSRWIESFNWNKYKPNIYPKRRFDSEGNIIAGSNNLELEINSYNLYSSSKNAENKAVFEKLESLYYQSDLLEIFEEESVGEIVSTRIYKLNKNEKIIFKYGTNNEKSIELQFLIFCDTIINEQVTPGSGNSTGGFYTTISPTFKRSLVFYKDEGIQLIPAPEGYYLPTIYSEGGIKLSKKQ